jgi:hypothetical protein
VWQQFDSRGIAPVKEEMMKTTPNAQAEKYRTGGPQGTNYGSFKVPSRCGPEVFTVLVSVGGGWDHCSVSLPARCPTWLEMCNIKALFFADTECAMQLHPPAAENINNHNFCLHLWRPQTAVEMQAVKAAWRESGEPWPYPADLPVPGPIPRPPSIMV